MTETSPTRNDIAKKSPVAPLAPLEYLQNQRRGSITDPSLHAAAPNPHMNLSKSNHSHFRSELPSPVASASRDTQHKLLEPRPASPYVFGDATPKVNEHTNLRRLLRSPSVEDEEGEGSEGMKKTYRQTADSVRSASGGGGGGVHGQCNGIDQVNNDQETNHFDPTMRRHSIAVGQSHYVRSSTSQGTKRKMSPSRAGFAVVGEEIDLRLSSTSPRAYEGGPLAKRRGSIVETKKIAELSLYDQRRNSVDSRGAGGAGRWWLNERRDATTTSVFSVTPNLGGYAPASAADSALGRPPSGVASFAWNSQPPEQAIQQMQNQSASGSQGPQGPFEPPIPQITMIPPITFSSDRRPSPPANVQSTAVHPPSRAIRSRSRPPSRQLRNAEQSTSSQVDASPSSSAVLDDNAAASPSPTKPPKDSGSTPYSRSPELRVSHKLAERKRRKEMKDLFDELRDQLPADRGMKASKWEILSKAIDFVVSLKQTNQEMAREIEVLRHELDVLRHGAVPSFGSGAQPHPLMYGQASVTSGQYPQPPSGAVPPVPQPVHPQPQISRPASSQNVFPPGSGPTHNGSTIKGDAPSST